MSSWIASSWRNVYVILSSPVCQSGRSSRRTEILDLGKASSSTQWRGTTTMGAPGAGRKVGAPPPVVLGAAATKAEALRDIFQRVLLEAGLGLLIALHGLCRGVPPYLGLARRHPVPCRWMIKIIMLLWVRACHNKCYLVSNGCDLKVVNSFESSFNLSSTNGIFLIASGER